MRNQHGIAVIGAGGAVRGKHLPMLARIPAARVLVLCDLDISRCRQTAAKFGVPLVAEGIDEVLAHTEVEIVAVCTGPAAHPEVAVRAMRAGKHVLVEKPLALSSTDCRMMIDEARRAGVVAATGFHMRYHRLIRQVRDLMRSGSAGEIESIRVVWHSPREDAGLAEWKLRRGLGGGALVEIGVHHLDLIRFLTGEEIVEIVALARNGTREDESVAISARTSGGVLVSGEFSERTPHQIEVEVSGRNALIRADCLRFDGLEVRRGKAAPGASARVRSAWHAALQLPGGLRYQKAGGDYKISFERQWRSLFDAVERHAQPEATFADGLRATEALEGAIESLESGRTARLGSPLAAAAPESGD